jgi:hypothetical protein
VLKFRQREPTAGCGACAAGGSRSGRGTPDSSSRVPRPYAAGRNDVMPFTAAELMIFKEAQATGRVAGGLTSYTASRKIVRSVLLVCWSGML